MKPILPVQRRSGGVSPTTVWTYVAINQLAFPGLGTILIRQRGGYLQAGLMVAGFLLITGYFIWFFLCTYHFWQTGDESQWQAQCHQGAWAWQGGLVLCVLAWLGALASSLRMMRRLKNGEFAQTDVS